MTLQNISDAGILLILALIAEIGVLLGALIWALLKAAALPAPSLLVISISLITILVMMVYVVTRSTEVLTLAGVPIGALVTASTTVFKGDITATQKVVEAVTQRLEEAAPVVQINEDVEDRA